MAFHPAEINHSNTGDSGPPLAGNHLADTSLSDFNTARSAMASPAIPNAFGNVEIDFGGDAAGSEVKTAAAENAPPTVSGPGCEFVVRQVPSPGFPNEHEVEVKPPENGGSCVVVIPPRDAEFSKGGL